MEWNIAAECISIVILTIVWIYSKKGQPLPTLKNKVFQVCLCGTFCAMASNIISTLCIHYHQIVPLWVTWSITVFYFITTPLMGLLYFNYAAAVIYEKVSDALRIIAVASIPGFIYLFFVIINSFTGCLFSITLADGYVRGHLISLTYIIFYLYCLFSVILVLCRGETLAVGIRRILFTFPILAFLVIVVQQIFVNITLSGSAATCALLIIYLYLQNKQITIDYATGLHNRLEFSKLMELQLSKRNPVTFCIIVVSLREFKQINRQYGQKVGDIFLRLISEYLSTITSQYRLYRFSGDEFAVYMEGANKIQLDEMVMQIQKRMTQPWQYRDISKVIPAAIGILQYPIVGNYETGVIAGVEYAVARAKQDKNKNICYCTASMFEEMKRRQKVMDIMKQKLAANEIELYLQPILSVSQWRFVAAEALMRMNQTPLGPLYPSEFIPIAEDTGMIIDITYQVLDKVCAIVKRLIDKGIEFDGISVNFSNIQFMEENLAQKVLAIIEKHAIPYSKIKIEITESVLAARMEDVTKFAEAMQEKGVLLNLDDFGTGYSNLSSVLNTPLDIIKLDKSLLWTAMANSRTASIVKNLTTTFQEMGLSTLVEGVETVEQSQFVINCGCKYIQGFLYAKPMPVEQAQNFIGKNPEGMPIMQAGGK